MEIIELTVPNKGWVSEDGSWGVGRITVFDPTLLTDEQWATLDDLSDSQKQPYVEAVINGEDLTAWEN